MYETKYLKGEKKRLKNKSGKAIFIIKNNTKYHLPILNHRTLYERWKLFKNIPNGIYKEYIFINHLGEKINHFKLKDVQKTNYTINTEKPCQQTMTIQK